MPLYRQTALCTENKYVGRPYSRAKIYAARMKRGSSSYRSISAAGPRPTSAANPPAAVATVDRWDRQTDGQTDKRTDTRPFYESYGVLCGARNNAHLTRVRSVHQSLAICCVFTSQQVVRVICGFASNYSDHLLRSKHATNRHRLIHRPDTGQVCVITRSAESI